MSINNVDKLLRNFQNYLMRQDIEIDDEDLDKSLVALANSYKDEFETYVKNNASASIFNEILGDKKFDDKDLNFLSTAQIGDDGKIKGLNELNNYATFSLNKGRTEEDTEITPEIKQAAQASGMDPKAFVKYALELGFSADEFATSVNEMVTEAQDAEEAQNTEETETSETETEAETEAGIEENAVTDDVKTTDVEVGNVSKTTDVTETGDVSDIGEITPSGETSTNEAKTPFEQGKDDISSIQDEFDSAKDNFDNAQNEYAALVNGDEYLLQNPDGKNSYASQIAKNLNKIQETETKRNEAQQDVSVKQTELNDATVAFNTAQTNLDNIMDNISELKTQLNALGKTSGDEYNALSNLLNEAIFEKLKAQKQLKEAQTAKDTAQTNLDTAKGKLDTLNGDLAELEQTKQSLDEVVQSGQNEALKAALQNYNNMKSELDSVQTKMEKALDTQETNIPKAKEINLYDGSDEVVVDSSTTTENPTSTVNSTSPSYTGGSSGGVGGSGSPSSSATTVSTADTLEDLKKQQTEYQGKVDDAINDLSTAQSEGQEKIDSAQKGYDSAKDEFDSAEDAYEKAVSNDNFLNSNPKNGKSYAEQISENLKQIQEAETNKNTSQQEISKAQGSLNDATVSVNSCQTELNSLETNLAAIDNAISTYDPQEGEDYDKAVAKKAEIEGQIETAKDNLEKAKTAKETAEKNLKNAQDKYDEACESLKQAEETKQELDKIVESNASTATKEAFKAYNTAKENLDKAETEVETATKDQTDAVEQARKNLEIQQTNLDTINKKIDEMEAQKLENEYGDKTDGKALLSKLKEAGGDAFNMFGNLTSSLGFSSDEETADYIAKLCADEEFGNNTIDPVLFIAQMCQESGLSQYNADGSIKLGDNGRAYGLGQIHVECATDTSVMRNHSYTAEDRKDPRKNLEMAILCDRYWYEKTGSQQAALGCYFQGDVAKGTGSAGQGYYQACIQRLGEYIA